MASKPYMPLMMGDWIKGTRGMRADVKGVYIGLLIHQYDHGYLPSDMDELALIEPEVGKIWVKLKDKFEEFEPGKLRNKKLEEVRNFWSKQASNGKKGGRPKKEKPSNNPNDNPEVIPEPNLQYDLDIDTDIELKIKDAFDEKYVSEQSFNWRHKDFDAELTAFKIKVRGSPDVYRDRTPSGLRLALQSQLRNAKDKQHARQSNKGTSSDFKSFESADYAAKL